jgi:nicotinate-nucleotide adenylyltransferase
VCPDRMSGSLAVYGGTFDPVHYGHLRSAIEIWQALCVDTVCLVPSYLPPHRQQPDSTPEQRLEMLRLAIDGHVGLRIDDREIKRKGPSFMVETLESIRQDVGADASLSLVLGSDAFAIFSEWRRWEDIIEIAHLVVLERPVESPQELLKTAAGKMTSLRVTQLEISATMIRDQINVGLAIDYLLPEKVQDYISQQKLYSTP